MTAPADDTTKPSSSLTEKLSNSSAEMMEKLSSNPSAGVVPAKDVDIENNDEEMMEMPRSSPSRRASSTVRLGEKTWFQRYRKWIALASLLLLLLIIILASVLATRDNGGDEPPRSKVIVEGDDTPTTTTTSPPPPQVTTQTPTISPTSASTTLSPTTLTPTTMAPTTQTPTLRPTAAKIDNTLSPTHPSTTSIPTSVPTTNAPTTPSPTQTVETTTTTQTPTTVPPSTLRPTTTPSSAPLCDDENPCDLPLMCVLGSCASQRLPEQTSCKMNSDCQDNRCGLEEYSETAASICCPDGQAMVFDVAWSLEHPWVCRQLPADAKCSDDKSCASGACVAGSCAATKLLDGATCDSHRDCQNRSCGRTGYSSSAPWECCTDGDALLLDVDWNFAHEHFCMHSPAGAACNDDRVCASSVCVQGKCAVDPLEDKAPCEKDSSCASGYCGREEFLEDAPMVCCANGDARLVDVSTNPNWRNDPREWICGQIPLGKSCYDDSSCASGVCSLGTCVATTLAENDPCDSDHDCTNGRCGRSFADETAPIVCCPEGRATVQGVAWSPVFEWICSTTGQPQAVGSTLDGDSCARDLDCVSRTCGKDSFTSNAENVCCQQGSKYKLAVPWGYNLYTFCGNLAPGTVCGDDRMCTAGNKCVQGLCSSELQPDGGSCGKHSDCSSRACAGGSFEADALQVCCAQGERYKLSLPGTYGEAYFCGNLPVGTSCGSDRMCETGLCIGGTCAKDPLEAGSECTKDSDCANLTCAKTSYVEDAENSSPARMECCTGGDSMLLHFPGGFKPDWYCDDVPRPIRAHCIRDDDCASGECLQNSCT